MRTFLFSGLVLGFALMFFGCAAEVSGVEPETDAEIAVQTEALVAPGCHGYVVLKTSVPPGLSAPSWYNGTVWSLNPNISSSTSCGYNSTSYESFTGPYATTCARYTGNRTWYCGGFGVVECPPYVPVLRPTQASDSPFGPFGTFGRYHRSFEPSLAFTNSYFANNRVVCEYTHVGQTYRYEPNYF